jgi:iron(III) transport system ATP-binding protein
MARGVSIEQVTFGYGATRVLDDISLEVARGEFFCFLGPSGSGKTTLLRLIAGFGTQSSGRIRIGERDVTRLPPWSRNVGMVFQSYALWPHMSVARNVAFGLERRKVSRPEITRRVRAALDLVGLSAFAERRPAQLSGGQQQRVALARTLVIEPDVLLLDEPSLGLAPNLTRELFAILEKIAREEGVTLLLVEQNANLVLRFADFGYVLEAGAIALSGAAKELREDEGMRRSYLGY